MRNKKYLTPNKIKFTMTYLKQVIKHTKQKNTTHDCTAQGNSYYFVLTLMEYNL